MKFSKLIQLKWNMIKNRWVSGGIVLMYHRIATVPHDPFQIAVSEKNFQDQMSFLKKKTNIFSVSELLSLARERGLPPRSVAITFDDGYEDNLSQAQPILEKYQIPATYFISTGNAGKPFWWDVLTEMVFLAKEIPVNVQVDQHRYQFEGNRQRYFMSLYHDITMLPPSEKWIFLDNLKHNFHFSSFSKKLGRALTEEEILQIATVPEFTIGGHTEHHVTLRDLSFEDQKESISKNKFALEQLVGKPVVEFSYPHGSYNQSSLNVLKELGFSLACCSQPKGVFSNTEPFTIPRIMVPDWPLNVFKKKLHHWLGS